MKASSRKVVHDRETDAARRSVLAVVLLALMGLQAVSAAAPGSAGGDPRGLSPAPMATGDPPVWSDSFEDASKVYILPSGLVGVRVSGGTVTLQPGKVEGWVASVTLTCPAGYRYDFVRMSALREGASQLLLSVVDATRESAVVGFANETIKGYTKVNATELSLYDLDPARYPEIRIQASLVANGTERPTIFAWYLHYVSLDEWRDDFYTKGKMLDSRRINITEETVMLDFSKVRGGGLEYEPYPTVVMPRGDGNNYLEVMTPNSARTGYNNPTSMVVSGSYGVRDAFFADLNMDGYVDLAIALYSSSSTALTSQIWWGNAAGTLTAIDAMVFVTQRAYEVDAGDFNGDGAPDLVFRCSGALAVFLNDGDGSFEQTSSVRISTSSSFISVGDFNGDDYDDIAASSSNMVYIFRGGPDGPSINADQVVTASLYGSILSIKAVDLDVDGFTDLLCSIEYREQAVFLGGPSGVPSNPSLSPQISNSYYSWRCGAGDVNGDGYMDLVFFAQYYVEVFLGSHSGWPTSCSWAIICGSGSTTTALAVIDVDMDGYDDLLVGYYSGILLYRGGESAPVTPSFQSRMDYYPNDITVAASSLGSARKIAGGFTTCPIRLPPDRKWDDLVLDAEVPDNTTVQLSVLDANKTAIPGMTELCVSGLDLSGLTVNTIHVRVSIETLDVENRTTPRLERIVVEWMGRSMWRERFYTTAKVDRLINLDVSGGSLVRATDTGVCSPPIVTASLGSDRGIDVRGLAFVDAGGRDYLRRAPIELEVVGTSGVDVADANGDGFLDIAYAVHHKGAATYHALSPLFLGSPMGWRAQPDASFQTVGAADVLIADVNGDGHMDLVFAQDEDGTGARVNSTLFWGSSEGWNQTPSVEFHTSAARGVAAADFNGDGRLDLAFACYKATSTATESMVFVQTGSGFTGAVPTYRLPTNAATAVAAGDLNGDGRMDVVLANSFYGGAAEIDSYIYWGASGGGFMGTPLGLMTAGAQDVKVHDLDGDGDLDVVFANCLDDAGSFECHSYVYLNDGHGNFPTLPSARLPTSGACAVAVADLDGSGRMDLLFACGRNSTTRTVASRVFLGGWTGWSTSPWLQLPTEGASDIAVARELRRGVGGYLSQVITPEEPESTGTFDKLRYVAGVGTTQEATMMVLDAQSWEVLAETELLSGEHEWDLVGAFRFKDHPSIRIAVTARQLHYPGDLAVDDILVNWSERLLVPPVVSAIQASPGVAYRGQQVTLTVGVADDYDEPEDLFVRLWYRCGPSEPWQAAMLGWPIFRNGAWDFAFAPRPDAKVGEYDFRATALDTDGLECEGFEASAIVKVLNNPPTKPEVRISPAAPNSSVPLRAEVVSPGSDVETALLTHRFRWFRDGVPVEDLTSDTVPAWYTSRGENWSVEATAFDGESESPPSLAWVVVRNSAPVVKAAPPVMELFEDVPSTSTFTLLEVFEDPDGDSLSWSVDPVPAKLRVQFDQASATLTVFPSQDWYGEEAVGLVASDGELMARVGLRVLVRAVNDAPRFVYVNGVPVVEQPVRVLARQGELLVVQVVTQDLEGDLMVFSVNPEGFMLDPITGSLRFTPTNDDVGTLYIELSVWDPANPAVRTKLVLEVVVEDANDEPGQPVILSPSAWDMLKDGSFVTFVGSCDDPDLRHGQVLNYTWTSNVTGLLGYGRNMTAIITTPGRHLITLTVRDPGYEKTATVEVQVEKSKGGEDDDGGLSVKGGAVVIIQALILVVLVLLVALLWLLLRRQRKDRDVGGGGTPSRPDE